MSLLNLKITNKLYEQDSKYIFAEDLSGEGHKRYIGGDSVYDLLDFVDSSNSKNFYEVCPGLADRTPYFDFDSKHVNKKNIQKFKETINYILPQAFEILFGVVIDVSDIIVLEANTIIKESYHIIVRGYMISIQDLKVLHKTVSNVLGEYAPEYKNCLDSAIYGSNQCFRLVGSCKYGKCNELRFTNESHHPVSATLINYQGEKIKLIKKYAEVRNQFEIARLNKVISYTKTDHVILNKVVMGLNKSRAVDFVNWRKVIMALASEGGGLDLALRFSKQSPNFCETATTRLHETSINNDTKRPLTIATLFAMLKNDNFILFKEITHTPINNQEFLPINMDNDDDDVERERENIPKEKKIKRESSDNKIKRWLSNKEYTFFHKSQTPGMVLDENDNHIIYDKRYMDDYPDDQNTMVVKSSKGSGKTYALEQYIKKHNPEYCIFISFRRTLSNEIIKRLSKHGFENYLDIKGPIDDSHKRIIIQVESLQRLRWTSKPDLCCFDEIESGKSQFFSDTCRFTNAVIGKYELLLEHSKIFMALDADISNNTIYDIKKFRKKPVCFIENIHTGVQNKFKEYYTSKSDVMLSKLSTKLNNNEKIIIATNRSISFMKALKQEILEKFPTKTIQLFNSKTIRDPEVSKSVKDTDTWKNYDIVIYSPTISAGVSVDYEYFDCFFAYFVNNGKVNAMRQMINRVRNFKTNKFYFCLQSFGGSTKPQNYDEMEKYITSNRFTEQPNFIFSKQNYDGSKTYPYKNLCYQMWIHDQIELAKDKSMFLFNFLRSQYEIGVGSMNYMDINDDEQSILLEKNIKLKKKVIDTNIYENI